MNKTAREIKEKKYERTLRVLRLELDIANPEKPLIERLKDALCMLDERYSYAHHGKWRAIVEIVCDKRLVFYSDIQSVNGGGSWAQAKHKALRKADYTRDMDICEIKELISNGPLANTEMAKSIYEVEHFGLLTKKQLAWIVDVDNGPGLAPGYGGIKIPVKILYRDDEGTQLFRQNAWIKVSFSGATQYQDLYFAFGIFDLVIDTIKGFDKSIRLSYDLEGLLVDAQIAFLADTLKIG